MDDEATTVINLVEASPSAAINGDTCCCAAATTSIADAAERPAQNGGGFENLESLRAPRMVSVAASSAEHQLLTPSRKRPHSGPTSARRSAIKRDRIGPKFEVADTVRLKPRAKQNVRFVVVARHSDIVAVVLLTELDAETELDARPKTYGEEYLELIEDEPRRTVDAEIVVSGLLTIALECSQHDILEVFESILQVQIHPATKFIRNVRLHVQKWVNCLQGPTCNFRMLWKDCKSVINALVPPESAESAETNHDESNPDCPEEEDNVDPPLMHEANENIMQACANDPVEIKEVVEYMVKTKLLNRCCFDVRQVLWREYELLIRDKDQYQEPFSQIGAGQTQVGKTTFKMVYILLASRMGCSVFVVTPNSANCIDLEKKMSDMCKDKPFGLKIMRATGSKQNSQKLIAESLCRTSNTSNAPIAFVCLFSKAQLGYVRNAADKVPSNVRRKMVFLLDEADDFLKHSYERNLNQQEIVLNDLLENYAHLFVEITASPIPLIIKRLKLLREGESEEMDPQDFIVLKGGPNYTGIDRLQPLEDANGNAMYLEPGSLTWRNAYFYTDTVLDFMQSAIEQDNSLIVCVTNPRIRTEGGVFEAGRVLCEFYKDEGIIIISLTGEGIAYRIQKKGMDPASGKFVAVEKKIMVGGRQESTTIGWVIDHLVKRYNWKGAIVVIGYTMLNRGVSLHCKTRVPTHLIVNLKTGQSSEKVLQALGRGTGNFKDQLSDGVVKVLTTRAELDLVLNYQDFLDSFYEELTRSGGNVKRSFRYATMQAPILSHCGKRSIGHSKYEAKGTVEKTLPECILLPDVNPSNLLTMSVKARMMFFEERGVPLPENGTNLEDFVTAWEAEQERRIETLSQRYLEEANVQAMAQEDYDDTDCSEPE